MVIEREFIGTLDFKKLLLYEVEKKIDIEIEKALEITYNNSQVGIVAKETLRSVII